MNKITLLFLLFPFIVISQVQIGQDIYGEFEADRSGWSVSLSDNGNVVAISSIYNPANGSQSGHVRVYQNISDTWMLIGDDIDGENENDGFGTLISLSANGNVVAVGARGYDDPILGSATGYVKVYENIAGTWTQIGDDIIGVAQGDEAGKAVSLSDNGNIVAVGAYKNDDNGALSGHVRVFENISDTWTQIGNSINGEAVGDISGNSINLNANGDIVAIGARSNDDNGNLSGHVRIFKNSSGNWTQVGDDINGEAEGDQSGGTLFDGIGNSISLNNNGNIVAIGAGFNDGNGLTSGHVRVFENISETWTQIGNDIDGESAGDGSGNSICLSANGNVLAIGAAFNVNANANGSSGHVRIYENQSGTWTQIGIDIDGESIGDVFGGSISLSADGSVLAIGANQNDNGGFNRGTVYVYDLSALLSTNDYVLSQFRMYPNPSKNQFTIQLNTTSILEKVTIYNTLGQKVLTSENTVVDSSKLASGSYIVEIQTTQGKATKKLIID